MKIMLFTNRCPMCGKVNFLKLIGKSIEERRRTLVTLVMS